jgi:phosphoserine aminotransferase
VMEMSHRGKEFIAIHAEAESLLRELLAIPANYKVLFMQGGAIGENAIVPMNLLRGKDRADYIHTGEWSKKSIAEAKRYCKVNVAASAEAGGFSSVPPRESWKLDAEAAYVHICANETIGGVEYHFTPDTGAVPLVADMSSNILSRPVDVARYGLIYGGAQKNLGPSGLTLVVIREDLAKLGAESLPTMLRYATHVADHSLYNTPPVFGIYILRLVLKWLRANGGLEAMAAVNERKAGKLYAEIDRTGFYRGHAAPDSRSLMNVTFRLPSEDLEKQFDKEATAAGLDGLKGHRSVGGMRASIYNAFPEEGVDALVQFMRDFEQKRG